jgi:hypothetical protein
VRSTDQTHRIVIGRQGPVIAVVNVQLLNDRASVGAEWGRGETTLGAATVAYSDSDGVVLRVPFDPEDKLRLALVPPPAGATEAVGRTQLITA